MTKEDEEFLARVAKEEAEEGLVLERDIDAAYVHKVVKRLIGTPPAPKQQRVRKHRADQDHARKLQSRSGK